jgi:hypothetical protein
MAQFCIPFMLEKIQDGPMDHRIEAIKALHYCFHRFYAPPAKVTAVVRTYLANIWSILRELVFECSGGNQVLASEALECLFRIAQDLAPTDVAHEQQQSLSSSTSSTSSLDSSAIIEPLSSDASDSSVYLMELLAVINQECLHHVEGGQDSAIASKSVDILARLAESSSYACNLILAQALPIFAKILDASTHQQQQQQQHDASCMDVECHDKHQSSDASSPLLAKRWEQVLAAQVKLLLVAMRLILTPKYPTISAFKDAVPALFLQYKGIITRQHDSLHLSSSEQCRQRALEGFGVLVAVSHPHKRKNPYLSLPQCLDAMTILTNELLLESSISNMTGSSATGASSKQESGTQHTGTMCDAALGAIKLIASSGNDDLVLQKTVPPLLAALSRLSLFSKHHHHHHQQQQSKAATTATTTTAAAQTKDETQREVQHAAVFLRISSTLARHPAIFSTIAPALLTLIRALLSPEHEEESESMLAYQHEIPSGAEMLLATLASIVEINSSDAECLKEIHSTIFPNLLSLLLHRALMHSEVNTADSTNTNIYAPFTESIMNSSTNIARAAAKQATTEYVHTTNRP